MLMENMCTSGPWDRFIFEQSSRAAWPLMWPLQPSQPNHSNNHNSNHLSVNQWIRSAIRDSQQATSPIGFLFWNFRHRLVRYYWYQQQVENMENLWGFAHNKIWGKNNREWSEIMFRGRLLVWWCGWIRVVCHAVWYSLLMPLGSHLDWNFPRV